MRSPLLEPTVQNTQDCPEDGNHLELTLNSLSGFTLVQVKPNLDRANNCHNPNYGNGRQISARDRDYQQHCHSYQSVIGPPFAKEYNSRAVKHCQRQIAQRYRTTN